MEKTAITILVGFLAILPFWPEIAIYAAIFIGMLCLVILSYVFIFEGCIDCIDE